MFKLGRPGSQRDTKASKTDRKSGQPQSGGTPPGAAASPGGGGDGPAGPRAVAKGDRPKPDKRLIAAGVAAAVVVAGAVTWIATKSSSPASPSAAAPAAHRATGPMHVGWVYPASRAVAVNGAARVEISFSQPVAADSPRPRISPQVPGQWVAKGHLLVFTPASPFSPSTQVTVSVPGGPNGVRSAGGALLTSAVTDQFTTRSYTQLGLAELLAEQGYLPMTFSATSPAGSAAKAKSTVGDATPASLTPAGMAYSPPAGSFSWEPGYPSSLASQWNPNQANVLLRGAVMAFQSEHSMTPDGSLTPQFWRALFRAQESGQHNQNGYTYAVANKGSPETLTVYHNGRVVLHSLANTGIPEAPTVDGTFPVFERFVYTIMSGTNPGGSHYSDPVWWVSYFNGGDAVHYFPRYSYGYQQSLGCVELPWAQAKAAYPYLTYGSLVTVQG